MELPFNILKRQLSTSKSIFVHDLIIIPVVRQYRQKSRLVVSD